MSQIREPEDPTSYSQRLKDFVKETATIGEACLGTAYKPNEANVYRTHILENGHHSHFRPCRKEKPAVISLKSHSPYNLQGSPLARMSVQRTEGDSWRKNVFQRTEDDDEIAPSIEDKGFIEVMDKEMFIDEGNNWVAPLPFRPSRLRLPKNREQARSRFKSLCCTLDRKAEIKQHFVALIPCRAGSTISGERRVLLPPYIWSVPRASLVTSESCSTPAPDILGCLLMMCC